MLQRIDWTLMVLAAGGGKPLQPVQLQKSLFLVGRNVDPVKKGLSDGFYDFQPYDYGPFDRLVYEDAERLAVLDLATITMCPGGLYREYAATVSGIQRAKELETELPPGIVDSFPCP